MRKTTLLLGPMARAALAIAAVGLVLLPVMILMDERGPLLIIGILAVALVVAAGLRTAVVCTTTGVRIAGEALVRWEEIEEVHVVHDGRMCFPRLMLDRGRALMPKDIDGLAGWPGTERVNRQAAQLARWADAELIVADDEPATTDPGAARRSLD